jgi:hypothetical protein
MTTAESHVELDVREKIAHIDQMLADHERIYADTKRINADHDRKRQEIRYAPWVLILPIAVSLLTAGAALFAAGAAFMKFVQP